MKKTAQPFAKITDPHEIVRIRFDELKEEWGKKYPAPVVIFISEMVEYVALARKMIRDLAKLTVSKSDDKFDLNDILGSLKMIMVGKGFAEDIADFVGVIATEKARRLGILTDQIMEDPDLCQKLIKDWMGHAHDADAELSKLFENAKKVARDEAVEEPKKEKAKAEDDDNCDCHICTLRRTLEDAVPGLKEDTAGKDVEIHVIY